MKELSIDQKCEYIPKLIDVIMMQNQQIIHVFIVMENVESDLSTLLHIGSQSGL